MKTSQCEYLLRILENTFQNSNPQVFQDPDCRAELEDAVSGIDSLLENLTDRLDQQKALIVSLEARLQYSDERIDKRMRDR